jgi:diguanylate cyclase (GGDEF)-like protein
LLSCFQVGRPFLKWWSIANINLLYDIQKREEIEQELWKQAYLDSLTGLGNRRHLYEALAKRISMYQHNREETSLLFLDLDRFKLINDSQGHFVGDFVLQQTATALTDLVKPHKVYRLGGDEFVILLKGSYSKKTLEKMSTKILENFINPMQFEEKEIYTTASIGIATLSPQHKVPDDIVRDSDIAMYHAKKHGLKYSFYSRSMMLKTKQMHELDTSIRQAMNNNEFTVFYQPIHNLKTMQIESLEVLIRWFHPSKGVIPPGDFIPIAEQNGYIHLIGIFLVDLVCQHTQDFLQLDQDLTLSLNLSAIQLKPKNINTLIGIITKYGIPMSKINVELTESVLIDDNVQVATSLNLLKDQGITLHLDDFGTGYSSLAYLQSLPISVLKIDRAFVSNTDNRNIAKAVQIIAENLNLSTIAEGIETKSDLEAMQQLGCNHGQGYYFAKPMSFEQTLKYIKNHTKQAQYEASAEDETTTINGDIGLVTKLA